MLYVIKYLHKYVKVGVFMVDLIVIGAGPAGLTAALYALRAGKTVTVLEKGVFGGQMTYSPKLENYPGFLEISGNELADKMMEQVLSHGAELEMETVTAIETVGETKKVITENGHFEAKAVIVATGAAHRHLGVEGEEALIGNGISFCAVCDGDFYKGQTVAVIGGGNSALQEALLLSKTSSRVIIVQNLSVLTGEQTSVDKVLATDNIEVIFNSVVTGFEADTALKGVKIKNTENGEEQLIPCEGVFVAIGLIPDTAPFRDVIELDSYGYVKADESCLTNIPGVFTAGDCRTKAIRQISTAISDGAAAALAACKYIG